MSEKNQKTLAIYLTVCSNRDTLYTRGQGMVLSPIYNNLFSFGVLMLNPTFECHTQLQTLDALRAIFMSALGYSLHGLKLESDDSGYIYWTALMEEHDSVVVERIAQGITGDLLRQYAYRYVTKDVRSGSIHTSKAHRISREMIQFNRFIVYQADSTHGSQFPDFTYTKYPTSNPHVSIYVFDLVGIQEYINEIAGDGFGDDVAEHSQLIEDFRKAGMRMVEKDGVAAVVRGQCALKLVS